MPSQSPLDYSRLEALSISYLTIHASLVFEEALLNTIYMVANQILVVTGSTALISIFFLGGSGGRDASGRRNFGAFFC